MHRIGAGDASAHVRKLGDHAAAHLEDAIAAAVRAMAARAEADARQAAERKAKDATDGK
jgi:hypothetical protein